MVFDDTEYNRWLKQAKNTLEGANKDLESSQFNWACFKAHQATEFALKAILYGFGNTPFGHSLRNLGLKLSQIKNIDISEIYDCILLLDRHYIPTRYADSFSEGAPFEYYTEKDAIEAIECAKKIMKFIEEMRK